MERTMLVCLSAIERGIDTIPLDLRQQAQEVWDSMESFLFTLLSRDPEDVNVQRRGVDVGDPQEREIVAEDSGTGPRVPVLQTPPGLRTSGHVGGRNRRVQGLMVASQEVAQSGGRSTPMMEVTARPTQHASLSSSPRARGRQWQSRSELPWEDRGTRSNTRSAGHSLPPWR